MSERTCSVGKMGQKERQNRKKPLQEGLPSIF